MAPKYFQKKSVKITEQQSKVQPTIFIKVFFVYCYYGRLSVDKLTHLLRTYNLGDTLHIKF